jgi:2-keto-myo-inositol isomerase
LIQVLKDLKAINYRRTLSLEIFKRDYWKQDPKLVAKNGLSKMRDCIAKAGV